jgi:hypothetical protein
MKFVCKTTNGKSYLVKLPNYFDLDKTKELLEDVKHELPTGEKIVEHHFYSDGTPTLDERKQYDCYGKIVDSPIELQLS